MLRVMVNSQPGALSHIRICDFTGQLAGAGATRFLAAFGAEVIRIEDPTNEGRWDILRGIPPFPDERRGINLGGAFNNHNVNKLGITLNVRTERGKELLRELVKVSDVVSENFGAGVLDRWGFGWEQLKAIREDIIYVSNCGFGHSGPYESYKTWGPVVQAVSGLTFSSGLRREESAGWGYSYMDHTGAYYMAMAIMMALHHRNKTGEGQYVDLACTEAAASLNGPAILDYTVNGRPLRREGFPNSNRNQSPAMAPHGIYPASGDDSWVAIACRDERDWAALAEEAAAGWGEDARFASMPARLANEDALDDALIAWTKPQDAPVVADRLQAVGVPATVVQTPEQRIDHDANTAAWGLWPTVKHTEMGDVRVDGLPLHMSETDWELTKGAACLGEDNERIYGELLGLGSTEIQQLKTDGVI